jgi:DNA polymerase/3'-5' exonuclease PolX
MWINDQVARRLEEVADLLHEQGANIFRVQAYSRAANTVRRLATPVSEILQNEGIDGLKGLAGIGDHLAVAIRHLVTTGRLPILERLRGEVDPIELLMSVPGIGYIQAERLHHELGIDSLEELEAAAQDGRLADIAGFGHKRTVGIIDSLATRLDRVRKSRASADQDHVKVAELLDVDLEYRQLAEAGKLHCIAPRRFNPTGEAWLPILHTRRGEREYTALFSNTARAHRLRKTHDWVILYHDGGSGERQDTAITDQQGPMEDKRIIRGRETECLEYYRSLACAACCVGA